MKKKIIMLGIILISATSLLLVIFYIKTKDIKYISSNEIESYSNISMTIDGVEITSIPTTEYYKIDVQNTNCNGNGSVNWSNLTNKLKVKVTNAPLKCTIALLTITEDINMVAMTVNGVESSTIPTSGWYNMTYSCVDENNNALSGEALPTITWDNNTRKLTTSNIGSKIFCIVNFTSTSVLNFVYTGSQQTITLFAGSKYKIELWGANGFSRNLGARGGYTKGEITFTSHQTLDIFVGEAGSNSAGKTTFNGGDCAYHSWPGGGSTDVRVHIYNDWRNYNGISYRIMVAGAGGTINNTPLNGYAGGLIGYAGGASSVNNGVSGGTQVSGNALGVAYGICGGGNGYYSGYGAQCADGGAGGSSYISGHTGCVAITSIGVPSPKSGCTTGTTNNACSIHFSGLTFTNTQMIDGLGHAWTNVVENGYTRMPNPNGGYYAEGVGHSGHGHARITYCPNGICP